MKYLSTPSQRWSARGLGLLSGSLMLGGAALIVVGSAGVAWPLGGNEPRQVAPRITAAERSRGPSRPHGPTARATAAVLGARKTAVAASP